MKDNIHVNFDDKKSDTFCTAIDLILNIFIEDFLALEENEKANNKETSEPDLLGWSLCEVQQRQTESDIR